MDSGCRRAFRRTRLVPGLFECGLLLCWGTVSLYAIAVLGIVGESTLLSCVNTTVGKRADDKIRVYWQRGDQFVHAFYSGVEHANQTYSNRTKLFTEEFKQGNFSLLLSDLQVSDEAEYTCFILMKQPSQYDVVLSVPVTLQVAAHYTEPELTAVPQQRDLGRGELVTLICSSWGGYPEPIVHWTDSILNILNENSTTENQFSCSKKELCNITSILRIQATLHSITCSIYNAKLQENKTATLFWNFSNKEITDPGSGKHHRWISPIVFVALVGVVSLAIYISCKCFCRSLPRAGEVAAQQVSWLRLSPRVQFEPGKRSHIRDTVQTQLLTEGLETNVVNLKEKD